MPEISQTRINSDLFIHIIAFFRHPHHYVPSTFGWVEFFYAALFLSSTICILFLMRKDIKRQYTLMIGLIGCVILLLCIGGYVFVEVFPSRIWVTAQTFRLLFIIKWIGLIFFAGLVANKGIQKTEKSFLLLGGGHTIILSVVTSLIFVFEKLEQKIKSWWKNLVLLFSLLVACILVKELSIPILSIFLLVFYILLAFLFSKFSSKIFYPTLLLSVIFSVLLFSKSDRLFCKNQESYACTIKKNLEFDIRSELGSDGDDIVKFVGKATPENSIFLTPPAWGQFRLLARRAIVVDYKAFPFSDIAMSEWYSRIINCYADQNQNEIETIDSLNNNYYYVDDDRLTNLKNSYNISYAVLFNQTPTKFEVIYNNDSYKVVSFNN